MIILAWHDSHSFGTTKLLTIRELNTIYRHGTYTDQLLFPGLCTAKRYYYVQKSLYHCPIHHFSHQIQEYLYMDHVPCSNGAYDHPTLFHTGDVHQILHMTVRYWVPIKCKPGTYSYPTLCKIACTKVVDLHIHTQTDTQWKCGRFFHSFNCHLRPHTHAYTHPNAHTHTTSLPTTGTD